MRRAGIYFATFALMHLFRYVLGAIMVIVGALLLLGLIQPRFNPEGGERLRTMFGIVLMLFGIYRIATLARSRRREDAEGHINRES